MRMSVDRSDALSKVSEYRSISGWSGSETQVTRVRGGRVQSEWTVFDGLNCGSSSPGRALSLFSRRVRMLKASNPKSIAPPVAMYSHSVEVPPNARWLYTAGQVGIRPDGSLPEGFEAQHDQIWQNTLAILADAGMGPENIVSYRQILVTAGPVRRRRLRADGRSTWRRPPARRRTSHPGSVLATGRDRRDGASFSARPRPA